TTVGAALDLPAIVAAARSRGQGPVDAWSAADAVATEGSGSGDSGSGGSGARRPIVAVAGGAAFTFGYAEHSELLTAAGADVVGFDP
ncbi:cobyrinate a,c-diamide synthase, partial [Streptomyces sp. SID10244]|nr:cobyrinate a,c-diamide synthase [Streptomyces sp. SID10244]